MADFRIAGTFGERVQAARKARGIKSAQALAKLIDAGTMTDSIIRNIESGRLTNPTISQVLNLAFALKVAPIFLLAPLGDPDGKLDFPGLSSGLASMSPSEFDAWLNAANSGAYRSTNAAELAERNELAAFRELNALLRERRRLRVVRDLGSSQQLDANSEGGVEWNKTSQRLVTLELEIAEAVAFLESSGWPAEAWAEEP